MRFCVTILSTVLLSIAAGCENSSSTPTSMPSNSQADSWASEAEGKVLHDRWIAARAITDPETKDSALEEIARDALSAAMTVPESGQSPGLVYDPVGIIKDALSFIADEALRDSLASEIAPKLAEAERHKTSAVEVAQMIVNETLRDSILSKLADGHGTN